MAVNVWEGCRAEHKASGEIFSYRAARKKDGSEVMDEYGNLTFVLTNLKTGKRKLIKENTLARGYRCWKVNDTNYE